MNYSNAKYNNLIYIKTMKICLIGFHYKDHNDIFVIGGEQIYKQFLYDEECHKYFIATKLYITKIEEKFECNVKFPRLHILYITKNFNLLTEYNNITETTLKYYYLDYELDTIKLHG